MAKNKNSKNQDKNPNSKSNTGKDKVKKGSKQKLKKESKVKKSSDKLSPFSPWLLLAIGLSLVAYFSLVNNQFINYDDDLYVTENPLIQNLEIKELFQAKGGWFYSQYSPVAMTLLGLEFKVFNGNPKMIRATSILIHLINVLLVFFIFRRLLGNEMAAGLIAMLFGVHPMQVESVSWLAASFKIGTYAMFFLMACLQYIKYLDNQKKANLVFGFFFFVLACMCKEQAVALPVLLLAIDYFKKRNFSTALIIEKIPFFVVSMIFGYITLTASSSGDVSNLAEKVYNFGFGERLVFACYSMGMYTVKLIVPFKLSAYYTYPRAGAIPAYFYVFPLLVIGLIASMVLAYIKDKRWLVFGILFFLINVGLTVFTSLLSVREVIMADRYVYLPCLGIFFILVHLVISNKDKIPFPSQYLLLAMGLIFTVLSFFRVQVWKTTETVFTDVINKETIPNKINPYLAMPYNNRGIFFKGNNQIDKARKDFESAIKCNSSYPSGYMNRGNIYFNEGMALQNNPTKMNQLHDLALADYDKTLELDPKTKRAYSARGGIYANRGQYEKALVEMNKSIELDSRFVNGYSNRALIYLRMNRFQEAIQDCTSLLKLDPTDAPIYDMRGVCHANLKNYDAAIADYTRAIKVNPRIKSFYQNRAKSYRAKGMEAEAQRDEAKAGSM